jgi:hypothetical protein
MLTEHERAMGAIRRTYWMFRPLIALGRVLAGNGVDARQYRIVRGDVGSTFQCSVQRRRVKGEKRL